MKRLISQSKRVAAEFIVFAMLSWCLVDAAIAGGDWNDEGIGWRSWGDAISEANETGKPICLVVYTETCPHCTNYSKVFHDGGVEAVAKDFVMVRIDQDRKRKLALRFAPDGAYIPRTLFFTSEGEMAPEIQVDRPRYVHFYDEHDPEHIREAMKAARPKLMRKPKS